jgi:hypothetical protein
MNLRAASVTLFATSMIVLAACGGGSNGSKTAAPATVPTQASATAAGGSTPAATKATTQTSATASSGSAAAATKASGGRAGVADAALANTCAVLSEADLAPLGKVSGPGQQTPPSEGGGVKTALCGWQIKGATLYDGASVVLTVYVFSDKYSGPKEFAKAALKTSADSAKASVETVSGVGDYAGVEIPPTPAPSVLATFDAQNGSVVVEVTFGGTRTSTWPTSAQLQQVGKAAAAKVF